MNYKFIFLCPIESLTQACNSSINYISCEPTSKKNVIFVEMNDSYENLALKMFLAFEKVKNLDFDFLCKVDVDTYINFENLKKIDLSLTDNYGFIFLGESFKSLRSTKQPYSPGLIEFPLGGGYILNKATVQAISNAKYIEEINCQIKNNICTFEDVMVGKAIKENNLSLVNSGYWIDKSRNCYSSCFNSFFHSLNELSEKRIKKISFLNRNFI